MQPTLVLFSGIRFPYYLAEKAIGWAKENGGGLRALFLMKSEKEEGYAFPNDLDAAERLTTATDARQDDVQIVLDRIKVLQDMAQREEVAFDSEMITDPSVDQVLEKAKHAARVFVDARDSSTEDEPAHSRHDFNMEQFIRQSPSQVERISER